MGLWVCDGGRVYSLHVEMSPLALFPSLIVLSSLLLSYRVVVVFSCGSELWLYDAFYRCEADMAGCGHFVQVSVRGWAYVHV